MSAKIERVSPIHLHIGDRVEAHGAVFEVAYIIESACDIPNGIRVAACISRLVSTTSGSIPIDWLVTPKSLRNRGSCCWADDLPEGLYWNIQGNAHAKVSRILSSSQ